MKNLLICLLTFSLSLNAGAGSFSSPPYVPGNVTIQGGTIDNTPIGSVTPSTGAFTTLSASGTVSGAGVAAYIANYLTAPGAIGGTTPSTGAFTSLSASGAVSGAGMAAYIANYLTAPGAIGATTPGTAKFTTVNGTTSYSLNGKLLETVTNPSISSGFGTTPTFTALSGTASFSVTIGNAPTVGVLTMPAATTGWNCYSANRTKGTSNGMVQTASTTTSATFAINGVLVGDVIFFSCSGY